jgi:transcriptional regulator with XRE-family HTH domain
MKTKKEKFLDLVSKEVTNTVNSNKERIKNRKRLKESQAIALKVLEKLDELGWNQRKLAKKMNVSPQQITKIVKGRENLTLETQVKLQEILNIPILATFYERAKEEYNASVKLSESRYII